ncbi:hypothetical protein ABOM_001363 [Aspergillus bombycis]|uniref:Uncharacterized protein n=1 Tax=Aspergillus bombycis TaxID=109264 RepID=A0A1F8AEB7_9EURO|nr:hypothetical protein ABOM_001363 [Aspergillus bombycis]OGM50083.1 hypothetical protein ABOM_001363 [Aspergillus bombycis]
MDLRSCSVRDPNGGPGSIHLHRMDAAAPTTALLSSSSSSSSSPPSSPMRELDSSSLSTSLNAMCTSGNRSLHECRQYLSNCDSAAGDSPDIKKLRRKNAALNLNQSQMSLDHHYEYPFSVSSVASSPPPLSPSHSPSALSEQPESLDGFLRMGYHRHISPVDLCLLADIAPGTPGSVDDHIYLNQNPHKILDTFRDRLERYPDSDPKPVPRNPPASVHRHTKRYSDSMLLNVKQPTTTIIHQGTSFEILNPHESLHFARIVSYIEDVDSFSTGHNRDSYISFTEDTVIIESDAWSYDPPPQPRTQTNTEEAFEEENRKSQLDIGDTQGLHHHLMPSINELLEETTLNMTRHLASKPRQCASPANESDLGEPGDPIYDDNHPMIPQEGLWQFDIGIDPATKPPSNEQSMTPRTEIKIHRRPTRRSTASRKRRGPLRRLYGLFRRKAGK